MKRFSTMTAAVVHYRDSSSAITLRQILMPPKTKSIGSAHIDLSSQTDAAMSLSLFSAATEPVLFASQASRAICLSSTISLYSMPCLHHHRPLHRLPRIVITASYRLHYLRPGPPVIIIWVENIEHFTCPEI